MILVGHGPMYRSEDVERRYREGEYVVFGGGVMEEEEEELDDEEERESGK